MIQSVRGSIVESGGEKEADCDTPLVEADDSTTNPLGGALGLVHWSHGGDHFDTETGSYTTNDEWRKGSCGGLKGDTDGEDEAC